MTEFNGLGLDAEREAYYSRLDEEEEDMNQRARQDLVSVDHPKWQIVLVEPIYNWQGNRYATVFHRLNYHVYYNKAYALRKATQLFSEMEKERPDLAELECSYRVSEVPKCAAQAAKFEDSDLPF